MARRPNAVADLLNPAALSLPAANVVMQLSARGVGYGVLESRADSGNVYQHPFKRARTRGTYLAAATIGADPDGALIRRVVDTVHAQVRSTVESPLRYNAFDPKRQLAGRSSRVRRLLEAFAGRIADRLGRTRTPLWGCDFAFLPWPLRVVAGPLKLFATAGFPAPRIDHQSHVCVARTPGQTIDEGAR
jgi:hypothetical protein